MTNEQLTDLVKKAAVDYGADVVGIGDPKRWKSAPFSRTPYALMADCHATISLGIHYLDSCIELGGSPDLRFPGPAVSNHVGSEHCNYAAFKLCKYIESFGYEALMVPSTGWWNYRENEDSPRGFSGDITHYYAAVAAGFGELGWNNLCLTPEFGPRQRLITLVTNAPLIPDSMYSGPALCDRCNMCEKKCPAEAFSKESKGPMSVSIGERTFQFQHKTLWRCACGENFQLDSFMERPEVSNEEVVLKLCEEAAHGDPKKRFTWKMGMCVKWCVPRQRRYMDKSFSTSFRRKRDHKADFSKEGIINARATVVELIRKLEISGVAILSNHDMQQIGIDSHSLLPNCQSAMVIMHRFVPGCEAALYRSAQRNALWIARRLEIDLGYDTLIECGILPDKIVKNFSIDAKNYKMHIMLSNIPFESEYINMEDMHEQNNSSWDINRILQETAASHGIELYGVTPVSRLDSAAQQLDEYYRNYDYFVSEEQGWGLRATKFIEMKGKPKNPAVHDKKLVCKRASEYVPCAKSVIVLGVSFLNGSVKNVGKGPAPKAAHYGVTVHKEMILQNEMAANAIALILEKNGYHAAVSSDLDNLASKAYSWMLPGIRANSIPALCAGQGILGKNGMVINKKYGSKVRYVAVITDAELEYNSLAEGSILCDCCDKCIKGCPASAIQENESVHLNIEGHTYTFAALDRLRCDWASQYGLMGDEGPRYLGCTNNYPIPEQITRENLVETIRSSDRLQITNFAPIVEHCVLDCPYNTI